MKKIAVIAALILEVFVCSPHLMADQETGTNTEHGYFRKPGSGDYGAQFRQYQWSKMDKADRAIHQGNIIKFSVEYPGTNEEFTVHKASSSFTIKKISAVLQADTGESVNINLAHGTNRSTAGTDLWTTDQTIDSVTTGETITSFDDADVGTNEWLWTKIKGGVGNVEELFLQIETEVD